jgi:hypothetical protein
MRKNAIKALALSLALVSVTCRGAETTWTDVKHLESGDTLFICKNKNISLTKFDKLGEIRFAVDNSGGLFLEELSLGPLFTYNGFRAPGYVELSASMTEDELLDAMENVVCIDEEVYKERAKAKEANNKANIRVEIPSGEALRAKQEKMIAGVVLGVSRMAFGDLIRGASKNRTEDFYLGASGAYSGTHSGGDYSDISCGSTTLDLALPKVGALDSLRLLVSRYNFSNDSYSEDGSNYKMDHKLLKISVFSLGLYARGNIFNENLHADSLLYIGGQSFRLSYSNRYEQHTESDDWIDRRLDPRSVNAQKNNLLSFGIRAGLDYDIELSSRSALRPGLHLKYLKTNHTSRVSDYDFSGFLLSLEPSLDLDFRIARLKTSLSASYEHTLVNLESGIEGKREGTLNLGISIGSASGRGGLSVGAGYSLRGGRDQGININLGYGF